MTVISASTDVKGGGGVRVRHATSTLGAMKSDSSILVIFLKIMLAIEGCLTPRSDRREVPLSVVN